MKDAPAMTRESERLEGFLDRLLAVPLLLEARLSPDAQWIAWIWGGLAETTQLWLAPADGSTCLRGAASARQAPPRRLLGGDRDCDWFRWAPDSRSLICARSRGGDERVGLWQVALDGSPPRALTEEHPAHYILGGEVTPDGRSLIYAANREPDGRVIEPALIYRQDIATGDLLLLARPARAIHAAPQLSPDGRHVLYRRNDLHPAGWQLWLADIDGGSDREILNMGAAAKTEGHWSPDGASVLVTAESDGHRRVGLLRLDRPTSGADEVVWLIDDPRRQISEAFWPAQSGEIVVEETRDARPLAFLLDPASGSERPFGPIGEGQSTPVGRLTDGSWIARHFHARRPTGLVRLALGEATGASVTILAEVSASPHTPAPSELAAAEDFRWTSSDGLAIQGWLYRAAGHARGTILLIHGGPTWHFQDEFMAGPQFFAKAGFNVLLPNYRGSTGFSLAFQEAIKAEGWGGAEQADIAAGAEALIRAGIAQPGRIGITGTSYGGYSSFWAITHFPLQLIAAAAPVCGMTDLVVDYETTRPDHRPYSEEMMGGSPTTAPARYFERSPINHVANIKGRLLIVQGANDVNVTPRNLTDMRRRLDAAGIAHEVLIFADEGHGIHRPANRRVLYQRLVEFFSSAFG